MKKFEAVLTALALLSLIICTITVTGTGAGASEIKTLRIGYQPSTHQIAEMTAMEKGWWERDLARFGVENVTDKVFASGPPEMTAMMAGEIDIAYVGTAPPISAIDKGLDAKIVAAVNTNGSALVLSPELAANYTSPEDLRGLKIATFPPGSIQDTILKKWLKDHGLDPERDVHLIGVGPGEAITMMEAGVVDGVFLPAPSPTIIEMDGAGKTVVYSGEMLPNHACCCLLVSGTLIREQPELVKQIVHTHINATRYNNEHMEEAAEIYARKVKGADIEKVRESLKRWDGAWVYDPHIEINSTLLYAKVDYEMGYTKRELTMEDLFDTTFYDELMGIGLEPMPTPTAAPAATVTPTPAASTPTATPGFTAPLLLIAALVLVTYTMVLRREGR